MAEFEYQNNLSPLELEKQSMTKEEFLRSCVGIGDKKLYRLLADINDVSFNRDTLRRTNELFNFLKDNGLQYDVIARADGNGFLANVKGIGGSTLQVTAAQADNVRFTSKGEPKKGNKDVGNIFTNGRSYYSVNRESSGAGQTGIKPLPNSYDMIKVMAGVGDYRVVMEQPKSDSNKRITDLFYQVYDTNNNKLGSFSRRSNFNNQSETELDEEVLLDDPNEGLSPLRVLVADANREMDLLRDDDNTIIRNNGGVTETLEDMTNIEITDEKTLAGLDLRKLRDFFDRRTIADAIAKEAEINPDFDLSSDDILPAYNPDDPEANGLKDLLAEQLAGVNAKRVTPKDLAKDARNPEVLEQGYQNVLNDISLQLERLNVKNTDYYFDEDHVIHWSGNLDGQEIDGQIGQVFLPDENIIDTKFKTVLENSDRNYHMVPGYRAYYMNREYESIVPKADKYGNVLRENGELYKNRDDNGNFRTFTKDELTGETLISHMRRVDNNKNFSQIDVEVKYKSIPVVNTVFDPNTKTNVIANVNNEPFVFNGKLIRLDDPSQFPPERIVSMLNTVNERRAKGEEIIQPSIGAKEPTLRDSLRLRGFKQGLDQQLHGVLQQQVLQHDAGTRGNTSLNKLYHGDVYASRVTADKLNDKTIIDTLASRVRFENDVMQLSPNEIEAPVKYDKHGNVAMDKKGNVTRDKFSTHRHNLRAFEDIFDRRSSSDGQALGLVRYLNKDVTVSRDGVPMSNPGNHGLSHAPIYDDIPFWYANPSDRSMMGSNQILKSITMEKCNVAYINYLGLTMEDASPISERYAERSNMVIGDKISDCHGNKSTNSKIAYDKDHKLFRQNPDLDIIKNPYSVISRLNTGLILELQSNEDKIKELTLDGRVVGEMSQMYSIKTNMTAEDKTHVYDGDSLRKGRSFGVQEAWVAQGLGLDGVLEEVYGKNQKSFDQLREYLNVTGIDMDENGVFYSLDSKARINDFRKAQSGDKELTHINPSVDYNEETGIELPDDGGIIDLPVSIETPTGHRMNSIYLLSENNRKTQDMFDGSMMKHDYTKAYVDIIEASNRLQNTIDENFGSLYEDKADLSKIDFNDPKQREDALNKIEDPKVRESVEQQINKDSTTIQNKANQLTTRVINDRLGGHVTKNTVKDKFGQPKLDENGNPIVKQYSDSELIKKSIIKKDIMGKQVPNSVTSVVTADPTVDLNKIRVSKAIFDKMDLKDPENDKVLLWRDPALHDGSMRAFSIELDEDLTGVAINPFMTQSFGMDFDGDTVGVYAPKSEKAQQDLREKAAIEKHLINRVTGKFDGNVSMDAVAGPLHAGYVSELVKDDNGNFTDKPGKIYKGPLVGREDELTGMNPKDQVEFMMTELAQKEDGWKEINDIWMDAVASEKNIGTSRIDLSSREKMIDSIRRQAEIGAKGKVSAVMSPADEYFEKNHPELNFGERLNYIDPNTGKLSEQSINLRKQESTVMNYYDRGAHIHELKEKLENKDLPKKEKDSVKAQLQYYMTPERPVKDKNGQFVYDEVGKTKDGKPKYEKRMVPNYGSLALDENNTRKAQGGKTDLTGQAGAKSQKAVGAMYDTDYMLSAMSVTEPLTQATLKLKKDPKMTPYISSMLIDYNRILDEGGLTNKQYKDTMHELYDGNKYNNLGLKLNDDDLDKMHEVLSENNPHGRTDRIDAVIERKASPLMKANLYGFDSIKDLSNNNYENIQNRACDLNNDKQHEPLHSLRDGKNAGKHVPKDLTSVSKNNVEQSIKDFHDRYNAWADKKEAERKAEQKKAVEQPKVIDEKANSRQVERDNANEQSFRQRAQYNRDAASYEDHTGLVAPDYSAYDANDRSNQHGTYDRSTNKTVDDGFDLSK